MKASGINFFYNQLGLPANSLGVFYTFEDGAGSKISSVSSGNSIFSGQLNSVGSFWSKPGSGLFSGNNVSIFNASNFSNSSFTHIFSYEKISTGNTVLFDCSNSSISGYTIGLTDSNKLYFQSYNNNLNQPIISTCYNNLGTKNLISLSYTTNHLQASYYNFNSQSFETESFDNYYNVTNSNFATLGLNYTGYMDYYLYFNNFYSSNILNSLVSGFYNTNTGVGYSVTSYNFTGITGYQSMPYIQTGITGYTTSSSGADGVGDFTGLFPLYNIVVNLTGIVQSGNILSGVVGTNTIYQTGGLVNLFYTNSGYAQTFGMDDINLFSYIASRDMAKLSVSLIPFDNNYNFSLNSIYSGYNITNASPIVVNTGNICLYDNGLGQYKSGWLINNNILYISGSNINDNVFFDVGSPGATGSLINFTGQQIFLNGLNLISGLDFRVNAGKISLTGVNVGINGVIFEYPIISSTITGVMYTGQRFSRDSSIIYINGLRQMINNDYVEGSLLDLMSRNYYNFTGNNIIYNDDNLYWDV